MIAWYAPLIGFAIGCVGAEIWLRYELRYEKKREQSRRGKRA